MSYLKWEGSTDPGDSSGTATYQVGGFVISLRLPYLADAMEIDALLRHAHRRGEVIGISLAAQAIRELGEQ
jgi:hypothetical protein